MRAEAISGPKVAMFAEIKRRADSYLPRDPAIGDHVILTLFVTGVAFENQAYIDRAVENFNYAIAQEYWDAAGVAGLENAGCSAGAGGHHLNGVAGAGWRSVCRKPPAVDGGIEGENGVVGPVQLQQRG